MLRLVIYSEDSLKVEIRKILIGNEVKWVIVYRGSLLPSSVPLDINFARECA